MSKYLILLPLVTLLAGCNPEVQDYRAHERERLFKECMQLLPAGPVSTHYNDWSDVVDSCSNQAMYTSRNMNPPVK